MSTSDSTLNAIASEPQHEEVLAGLVAFVDRSIVPLEEQNRAILDDERNLYTEAGGYTPTVRELRREVRRRSAGAGYYTMFVPEEMGGGGGGPVLYYRAWEHLHHVYGPGRLLIHDVIAHWTSGPSPLLLGLDAELQQELLPRFMSGDLSMCFGMSEPDAGSDAWAMSTKATLSAEGEWRIDGLKQWISNAPTADYMILFAVTDESQRTQRSGGITAFMVPTTAPGFHLDSVIRLYGHIGGNEGVLSFTDLRAPSKWIIGERDKGFALALQGISLGRLYNAARCVGMARWALEQAVAYAKNRVTFGQPIATYQGIQFLLADSAIDIYAGHAMSLEAAHRLAAGQRALRQVSSIKAFTTEMCFQVFDRCMQVLGGYGLTNEARMHAGWHQARTVRIADGTGEIMRRNIADRLLRGDIDF